MNNLLALSDINPWVNGLFVFFLGMIVVFFGMALIILVVSLIGKIMSSFKEKKQAPKAETAIDNASQTEVEEEIPENVRVAIMAVISAYYFEQNSNCEFRVKKIKRI